MLSTICIRATSDQGQAASMGYPLILGQILHPHGYYQDLGPSFGFSIRPMSARD